MITERGRALDVAWAAGLFEGEGSMSLHNPDGRRACLRLHLGMTDFDVVERFHTIVGVGSWHLDSRMKQPNEKPQQVWRASGSEAVLVLLEFLPYFGQRRRARAHECIEWFLRRFVITCRGCGQRVLVGKTSAKHCSMRCSHRVRSARGEFSHLAGPTDPRTIVVRTDLGRSFTEGSRRRAANAERLGELLGSVG